MAISAGFGTTISQNMLNKKISILKKVDFVHTILIMIVIEAGTLRFTEMAPKWWKSGVTVMIRKTKNPGSFLLFRSAKKAIASIPIQENGTISVSNAPDGVYDVMIHGPESVMLVPAKDYSADNERINKEQREKAKSSPPPKAPNFDTCSRAEFEHWILLMGKRMADSGRFSNGFPGFVSTMRETYSQYKMHKSPTKAIGAASELDYYDQLMKIIADESVSDTVKLRALKELQMAKPNKKKERTIRRIVVPD